MKKYTTPDFDVTIYEVEDILTASGGGNDDVTIGTTDPNGNDDEWFG